MKRLISFALASLVSVSLAGCVVDNESGEQNESSSQAEQEVQTIPADALAAMEAAKLNSNLQPQFFACPYYLIYKASGYDQNVNLATDWTGLEGDFFYIDKPSWYKSGSGVALVCGTTQSPHGFMDVRKWVTGPTNCTTSTNTPQGGAWFVCS